MNTRGVSVPTCSTPMTLPLDQQRHAEQRADPALAQDRVEDVGVVDVLDRDRAPLGRDPAREPAPHRDPDALLDLLLDALARRVATSVSPVLVEQQERGRVGAQDLRDPVQQLVQQLVRRQVARAAASVKRCSPSRFMD